METYRRIIRLLIESPIYWTLIYQARRALIFRLALAYGDKTL